MTELQETSASDLTIVSEERIQPIHVATQYLGRYQSESTIRDIAPFSLDEPTELGGTNAGPTALEMTLAALNSCSAMIMYVLSREMKFQLGDVRFETDGWVDVRRIEMRRKKLKYSEVEPVAEHYHHVDQTIHITTGESGERFEHFRSEVHRLCPMYALFRDAGVDLTSTWVQVTPEH